MVDNFLSNPFANTTTSSRSQALYWKTSKKNLAKLTENYLFLSFFDKIAGLLTSILFKKKLYQILMKHFLHNTSKILLQLFIKLSNKYPESIFLLYLEHGNNITESNKDHVTFFSLEKLIIACIRTTIIKR